MTKVSATFECEVECDGIRYNLFAELDIIERDRECGIEVTDWSATDAGGHEVTDTRIKRQLRVELDERVTSEREGILSCHL